LNDSAAVQENLKIAGEVPYIPDDIMQLLRNVHVNGNGASPQQQANFNNLKPFSEEERVLPVYLVYFIVTDEGSELSFAIIPSGTGIVNSRQWHNKLELSFCDPLDALIQAIEIIDAYRKKKPCPCGQTECRKPFWQLEFKAGPVKTVNPLPVGR